MVTCGTPTVGPTRLANLYPLPDRARSRQAWLSRPRWPPSPTLSPLHRSRISLRQSTGVTAATSAGILIAKGGGAFDVKGTHTYTHAGNFTVSGVIRDTGGSTATFSESLAVSAPVTLTSSVAALPATETSTTFTVSWSGTDVGGPGIAHYDVFVADNGGPFTPFQSFATSTSATFTGVNGHTYGFYSVATDNVGNRQATPTAAQATTAVSVVTALPTSTFAALALLSPATFTVSWGGSDVGGPGIGSFDVFVSDNSGPFTSFLTGTTAMSTTYKGVNGHTYGFFSVATDTAGNHQLTPASAQATTVVEPIVNERYVEAVYQDVLARLPDAGGGHTGRSCSTPASRSAA